MKYGRIDEITVEHATIRQQISVFDLSGKNIRRIRNLFPYASPFNTETQINFWDRIFVEFEDDDVFEVQGWDGEQYDEVFFISMNCFYKDSDIQGGQEFIDKLLAEKCYGKTIKGFRFLSDEDNAEVLCPHRFGIEFEDNTVLWFEQYFDETNVFVEDAPTDAV